MITPNLQPTAIALTDTGTDRSLLRRFEAGDQSAFTDLVRRHQRLVLGVCRRILKSESDAEDAFQATFFVLARRAAGVNWKDSIAGWLAQTARRTAIKLHAARRRQRRVEVPAENLDALGVPAQSAPEGTAALRELAVLLDEELMALPESLREVILLSQVEALDREAIAQRTGLSASAVKDRLERGREQLRTRLARRGVTFTATAMAAWLIPASASAAAETLTAATAQTAGLFAAGSLTGTALPTSVTLAQGVLKMMAFEKLKSVAVTVVAFLTAGAVAYGMLHDEPHRFEKGLVGEIVAIHRQGATPNVTIRLAEFDTLLNLDLMADVKVWNAFEAATLDQLREGTQASLRLASDHRRVREIHLQGQMREVTIQKVEPDGRITFVDSDDDEDNQAKPQTVGLAPDAILRIGGLPASRTELRPGWSIPIELSGDGQRINAIEAGSEDGMLVWGEVLSVDAANGTIRFRGEDGDDQEREFALRLLPETMVTLDGASAKVADIVAGSVVVIRRSSDRTAAMAIRASRPERDDDAE